MLQSLSVQDYALIKELEMEFESGLNIITGATGAGKSILIGALRMILGERANTDVVREGTSKAVVEGIFDDADTERIRAVLRENEIPTDPLPRVILRRRITERGSRGFVNDTPATLDVMRAVAGELIDLHGQHEHQSLLHTDTHLRLLDSFGGLGGLVESYREQRSRVAELVEEREALAARERELRQQKELYEFQIEEIDAVDPQPGEEDELRAEQRVLENAEHLYASTKELYERLFESEDALHDQLVVSRNDLQDLARIDDAFEEHVDEIESARIIVSELANFLQDYNAHVEFDPERLQDIRERTTEIEKLKRKYGGSLEAVLEHRREIGEKYELAQDFEGNLERLDAQIDEAKADLTDVAQRLSQKRREVATRIEDAILDELATLGMPDSQFEVRFARQEAPDGWIQPDDADAHYQAFQKGMDQVEFYISTNVGVSPMPLAEVASGGEISRIMLALKTILAKSERLPILVFDEIDVGISGNMARRVGESMHDLARYHQIITITHLPQIAALGDCHFKVKKIVEDGTTKTTIHPLDEDEQATQVASLISGEDITDAALASARELMAAGERDE
ncbi:DNA repair protein RecN [Salinibacter ruber]|uniref:DNA repair protein RecN n=1 Tax=Salinibacter ruber TaxID=146919 RepID=UPI002166F573|nr:DNA repair protein RecN [Salinibacter ruber]MCS4133767.1 DNA repair protein RecN (Recombination protein N) [Salinibacter ruber]